jgi:hypothetical protein
MKSCLASLCFLLVTALHITNAADFNVSALGSASSYTINGTPSNPRLTLVRGELYSFAVTAASSHPFRIRDAPAGAVTNNNIYQGTIWFKVPTNAASYRYDCSVHGFGNTILTIPPPAIRIVNVNVGSNIVLRSTGTNNWTLLPQYSTNLARTNWFALTVQSNRFNNGTNETFCGRPAGTNVFIRTRAQRN